MEKIPEKLITFIESKLVSNNSCLPQHYPTLENFNKFQAGYRYNGITMESLIGKKQGDWQENRFVICSNYFNDPFTVNFLDESMNFPVYFAMHGKGIWETVKIADSIDDFTKILVEIQSLESESDKLLKYFEQNIDLENSFWKDVYEGFQEETD